MRHAARQFPSWLIFDVGQKTIVDDEELYYRRSEISDRLAYLMVYAPDFPPEDRRTLEKEKAELSSSIARYERDYPAAAQHPRFPLFKVELEAAFEAAAADASDITRLFQIATDRFEETFCPPPKGPDFIAGPSGITRA